MLLTFLLKFHTFGHMNKQISLTKKNQGKSSYGGTLQTTRLARSKPRPLSTRHSMHLVLRSSRARGAFSFKKPQHEQKIKHIISKFAHKYGIKMISIANAGNHLHLHIKLSNRFGYKPFIRAITSSIATAVRGNPRWPKQLKQDQLTPLNRKTAKPFEGRFWDRRPFTRFVSSFKDYLRLEEYIEINQLEGMGFKRFNAKMMILDVKQTRNSS